MSSFYGNVSIGGSSGEGGTSNYNELINLPIKNLIGTDSSPIIISNLNYGNYLIKGSYKYNSNSKLLKEDIFKNIQVFKDETSQNKIAKFEVFENKEYYIITLTYENDGNFIEDRLSISSGGDVASEVKLITF